MTFGEFLVLLIAGLISAAVIHYGIGYRFLAGGDGFMSKWIAGWIGAWLGTPVLGHWFQYVTYQSIYLVPALVGAFVGSFLLTAVWKASAIAHSSQTMAPNTERATAVMPKAA